MGDTNYQLSTEGETERGKVESAAPSEEFFIADESELEFSGSDPPSNIWLKFYDLDLATIISGSTKKNLTKSVLSRSVASLSSKNRASTVHNRLQRICTPCDTIDKRVNFLKATVILGFVVLLVVTGYFFWPTPNPRGHNDESMLRNTGNGTNIDGNVMNFNWEGNELKVYIQYKSKGTYAMKRYDYELLEIQPVESYIMRSVMDRFQCEETKWVKSFVCCYDLKNGTVCARRIENNGWMLISEPFYRAEFLKKNEQDYLVAQERPNTMPYLIDPMGTAIPIETHECGDAFSVLRFDITNEKIAIFFGAQLSDKDRTNQFLLLIDPFDENDHKCYQREGPSFGKLHGIWVDRDVLWILFCGVLNHCSVHLLNLEGLKLISNYSMFSHGPSTEHSITSKHDPRFVGKIESNNLNIYTFVNGNVSAKIIRKQILFLDNNPKN